MRAAKGKVLSQIESSVTHGFFRSFRVSRTISATNRAVRAQRSADLSHIGKPTKRTAQWVFNISAYHETDFTAMSCRTGLTFQDNISKFTFKYFEKGLIFDFICGNVCMVPRAWGHTYTLIHA